MAKSLPFVLSLLLIDFSHGSREAVSPSEEAPSTGMRMMQVHTDMFGGKSEADDKPYSLFMDIIIKAISECGRDEQKKERCNYMNRQLVRAVDDTPTPEKFQDTFNLMMSRCEKNENIPANQCTQMNKLLKKTTQKNILLQVDSNVADGMSDGRAMGNTSFSSSWRYDHFMDIIIKALELCQENPTPRCGYMSRLMARAVDDTPRPEKMLLIFIRALKQCDKSSSDICTWMMKKIKSITNTNLMQVNSQVVEDSLGGQDVEAAEPEDHFLDIVVKPLIECEQSPSQRCDYMIQLLKGFAGSTPYQQRFPHILAKVLVECEKDPTEGCGYMQRILKRAAQ